MSNIESPSRGREAGLIMERGSSGGNKLQLNKPMILPTGNSTISGQRILMGSTNNVIKNSQESQLSNLQYLQNHNNQKNTAKSNDTFSNNLKNQ